MVNPKTIDSITATIPRENKVESDTMISGPTEMETGNLKKPYSSATSAIQCCKCKKDTLMEAIDQRVLLFFLLNEIFTVWFQMLF